MKTIVFDFDGVIHRYRNGWLNGTIYDSPDYLIVNAIRKLLETGDYSVCIQSTRDPEQIVDWIRVNQLFECDVIPESIRFWQSDTVVGVTNRKIPAVLYIDDRGFRFNPGAYTSPENFIDIITQLT